MVRRQKDSIYGAEITEREAEIRKLEQMRADLEKELEDTVREYVRAGGSKKLLRKKRKLTPLLLDGTDPDKL